MGLWAFQEGTGTVAYDYSGMNATGAGQEARLERNGYYSLNKAGAFDGASNVISTSLLTLNGASQLTVSFWMEPQHSAEI